MSIGIARSAALAFAASALMACASGSQSAGTATPTPDAAATTAPAACTLCKVEVENRYDYRILVFDVRDARSPGATLQPAGRVDGRTTGFAQTKGRPSLGMASKEDTGAVPTASGLKDCRPAPPTPGSGADFRYICGT